MHRFLCCFAVVLGYGAARTAYGPQQVVLQFHVFEAPIDFRLSVSASHTRGLRGASYFNLADDASLNRLLELKGKQGIELRTAPMLRTLDGMKAEVAIGMDNPGRKLRLTATPRVGDGKLQIDVEGAYGLVETNVKPMWSFETLASLRSGQRFLATLKFKDLEGVEKRLYVFVRGDLVD
jgi:hypothetical protein